MVNCKDCLGKYDACNAGHKHNSVVLVTKKLMAMMMMMGLLLCVQIPEVLLWAKEQSEELSPNLTTFTEHFNKMSYWWVSLCVNALLLLGMSLMEVMLMVGMVVVVSS